MTSDFYSKSSDLFFSSLKTSAGPSLISRRGRLWPLGTTLGCPGCRGSILMRLFQVLARTSPTWIIKKWRPTGKMKTKGPFRVWKMWCEIVFDMRDTHVCRRSDATEFKTCNLATTHSGGSQSFWMFNAVRGVSVAKLNSSPSFTLAGYDFT